MLPGLFSVFDQDVIFLFILGLDCFVTLADKSPKSWIYSLQWTPQNINVMTSSVIIFWWVRCLYKNSTMFVRSDVVLTFLHTHRRKWSWSITSSCLTLLRHDVIIRLIRIVWTGWHDQRSAVNTTKALRIISWYLLIRVLTEITQNQKVKLRETADWRDCDSTLDDKKQQTKKLQKRSVCVSDPFQYRHTSQTQTHTYSCFWQLGCMMFVKLSA